MLRKRTNAYWDRRSTERVALLERQSEPYIRKVNGIYADAQRDMVQQMKAVYSGYYTSQGWDKQALNSIAPTGDIKQFKAEMKRLGLDTRLPVRYKGRLTRIELLYAQMWGNAKAAGAKELALSHANYAALYENSYNLTVYEVSKGLTRTPAFTKLPTTQIEAALCHQFMGKNYSERIWKNTNDLALQLQKEVAKTIITGESPQKSAKRLRERYGVAKYKAERLMRTETARFQNEGALGAYESMGLDRWQFNATLDGRTSQQCFIGTDEISTLTPLDKVFRRRYVGEIITVTTASGKKLSGTPNHPILTSDGWLPLNKIEPSKHILYSVLGDVDMIVGDKNINVPTKFSKLFDSISKIPSTEVSLNSASATDFHEDVTIVNSKVSIASTDRYLRRNRNAKFSKKFVKFIFSLSPRVLAHTSLNSMRTLFFARLGRYIETTTPEIKIFTFGKLIEPALGTSKLSPDDTGHDTVVKHSNRLSLVFIVIGVTLSSLKFRSKAKLLKSSCHSGNRTPVSFGKFAGGRTVPVLKDNVVDVSVKFASRHVYNLQCDDNVYINNSILVHNCQHHDGKIYNVGDTEFMPPLHGNCRSATTTYIGGLEPSLRIARGKDGKNYYTANMSYEQWAEAYL